MCVSVYFLWVFKKWNYKEFIILFLYLATSLTYQPICKNVALIPSMCPEIPVSHHELWNMFDQGHGKLDI